MPPHRIYTIQSLNLTLRCLLLALAMGLPTSALAISIPGLPAATATPDTQTPAEQPAEAGQKPANAALADLLEDPQTRTQLIETLRGVAQQQAAATPKQPATTPSLPHRIAEKTQAIAHQLTERAGNLAQALSPAHLKAKMGSFKFSELLAATGSFALVVLVTVGLWWLLRWCSRPLLCRANAWAAHGEEDLARMLRRGAALSAILLLDIGIVALACAAGYATGLFGVENEAGSIGTHESLFINAFAMVEVIRSVIRGLFSTQPVLRLLPASAETTLWWRNRLGWFVGFIGYGLLVLVPIARDTVSSGLGEVVYFVIMLTAYLHAMQLTLKHRAVVRARLETGAIVQGGLLEVLLRVLARTWHLIAIVYFSAAFIITQLQPEGALPFLITATLQSLVAVAIAAALTGVLDKALNHRLHLAAKLHYLERRLNAYVPRMLQVLRLGIVVGACFALLDCWEIFNFAHWLTTDAGTQVIAVALRVLLVITIAMLIWTLLMSFIESRMSANGASARQTTLLSLFRTTLAILIVTLTSMILLSQLGVAIGPLLAGASVIGLAVGFGSQKLVSDVVTGLFIQMDNAMNVGDLVTVEGITGTVEKLGMRSTSIRSMDGALHILRFSSVNIVSNYVREFGNHVGEYRIAYSQDIDQAVEQLHAAFDALRHDPEQGQNLLSELSVHGVTALADSSVVIRIVIKARPGSQWAVGRAYNRLVKNQFAAAGIAVPYPHRLICFDKDAGSTSAPPTHLKQSMDGVQANIEGPPGDDGVT